MSGFDFGGLFGGGDSGGYDGTDWLSKTDTDLNPTGIINPNFVDYGNPQDTYTINDAFNGDTNYYDQMFPTLGGLSQATSGSTGSSGGFFDNLMGQIGKINEGIKNNPLGAIAAGVGAYGSFKDSQGGGGGGVNAVDKLMLQGQVNNAYNPQPVPYGKPVARDFRHYLQNFNADGSANMDFSAPQVSDAYKSALGRAPEQAGADWWQQQMRSTGMTPQQLKMVLAESPEAKINSIYKEELGRTPDFDGMNFWHQALQGGASPDQLREAVRQSEEYKKVHAGGLTQAAGGK